MPEEGQSRQVRTQQDTLNKVRIGWGMTDKYAKRQNPFKRGQDVKAKE